MTADEELDRLYGSRPEDFTALRTELAATAKRRGDTEAAKQISSARRPTTAAWIVNMLVRRNEDAKNALTDLGERMRAAHGAMDGERIRELSREQRRLVEEFARLAFESAELDAPSAALRTEVTGTLQAAVADQELAARLGRLDKAERWSGFGEFVETAPVSSSAAKATTPKLTAPAAHDDAIEAMRLAREAAAEELAAAQRIKGEADAALGHRDAERVAAEQRRDQARAALDDAEDELISASAALGDAQRAQDAAAERVRAAAARLEEVTPKDS